MNLLIKNACVITGCGPVFENGFIHIRDCKVFAVGPLTHLSTHALKHSYVIDAHGRYVLPGFINTHMHLYSAMARGMPCGRMKNFGQILQKLWWPLDRALTLEDIYVSALLGGIEAIKSGVTTLIDHHASYGAISGSLGAISGALAELKIRASLCFEISDRAGKRARDEAIAESGLWLESVENWKQLDPNFLQRGMVGLHASMTLSDGTLDAARELMEMYDVGAHVHVAEGIEDVKATQRLCGMSPAARLVKKGILRKGSLAIHCVHVDSRDISLIKKSGACVVHNPLSNLNNAVGIAPVLKMRARGITVAIGTDGMSAGISDDVKTAAFLHKISEGDAQAGGDFARDAVWNAAPRIASRMFGADIGVIRKGAAADIIIIDAAPPTPLTRKNAWWHVLFGVLNAPVRTTIIAGKVRMRDFKVAGVDEEALAREAKKLARKLWNRINNQ